MPCSRAVIAANRKVITHLFDRGDVDAAVYHRYSACCRASKCNFMCKWLVKGVGLRAFCTARSNETDRPELRQLLRDPEFECPDGAF